MYFKTKNFLLFSRLENALATSYPLITGGLLDNPFLPVGLLIKLFIIGIISHLYGFILNDIFDLKTDKYNPSRRNSPLIRGTITKKSAILLIILTIPFSQYLIKVWFNANYIAHGILLLSYLLISIYNIWGKNFPVSPIFADFILGISWGLPCILGAYLIGNKVGLVQLLMGSYFAILLALANSIEGGLKDLDTDLIAGVKTTPIWFGALIKRNQQIFLPPLYKMYIVIGQLFCIIIFVILLSINGLDHNAIFELVIILGALSAIIISSIDLIRILRNPLLNRVKTKVHIRSEALFLTTYIALLFFALSIQAISVILLGLLWQFSISLYLSKDWFSVDIKKPF